MDSQQVIMLFALTVLGLLLIGGYLLFMQSPLAQTIRIPGIPAPCPPKAQLVIDAHHLTEIHRCDAEQLPYGQETADLVRIQYGPGMDCPSGCIYTPEVDVVLENGTLYKMNDIELLSPDRRIIDFVQRQTTKPVTDLQAITTRQLLTHEGKFAIQYTFTQDFSGSVFIDENGQVWGDVRATGMTVEQATQLAIDALEGQGYEPDPGRGQEPPSVREVAGKNCWEYLFITLPKQHPDYDKCTVTVCPDATAQVKCT